MKLKTKMTCAVSGLIVVLLLIVTFFTLLYFEQQIKASISAQQLATVTYVADDIDSTFLELQGVLMASAKAFPPEGLNSNAVARKFLQSRTGLHKHFNRNIFVLSATGNLIAESFPLPHVRRKYFGKDQFFIRTIETTKPQISDPISCCQDSTPAQIMISAPIMGRNGKLQGVMVGAFDLRSQNPLSRFAKFKVGSTGFVRLISNDNRVLLHPEPQYLLKQAAPGNHQLVADAIKGFSGTIESIGRTSLPQLTSARKLKTKDWVLLASIQKQEVMHPIVTARYFFAGTALFGIFAAILIVTVYMNYLTRPLSRFTRHIQELPTKQGAERKFELHTGDEIESLAHSFNNMVADLDSLTLQLEQRVEERTTQLLATNETLESEIKQRAAAQEEITWLNDDLLKQKRALEVANKELESFSYSVSHDLRAPLRHVIGFSSILLADCNDELSAETQDCLKRITESCHRMNDLINDLLALSQVSRHEMNLVPVDISALCHDVARELSQISPDRNVMIEIADDLNAICDPHLVRIVLQNILGNAWKYTSKVAEPRIEVGQSKTSEKCEFFVRDNGAGFDMAYAEKLFSPFHRLHSLEDFEGTGIGLATVQRIINRHGGSIRATSEPGKGATFSFTLD